MNLLVILYFLFYFFLVSIRLEWAVMLILAILPSYLIRFNIFDVPFTLLEVMIFISFAVWFFSQTEIQNFLKGQYGWRDFQKNRKERQKYPFGLEIILLLIVSFVAVAVAGFSDSALGIWKAYFFEPMLFFILVLNVFSRREDTNIRMNANEANNTNNNLEKIISALAISSLVVSVLAIYQQLTGAWIFNEFWAAVDQRRVTSFFGYPNAVGLYLSPLILVMFGWVLSVIWSPAPALAGRGEESRGSVRKTGFFATVQNDKWKLFFVFTTIILSLLAIYFAKSKGALAGIIVGLIVFGLLAGGKKLRWAAIVLIFVGIIGVSAYQPLRVFCLEKTFYSKSLQIREQQWRETMDLLKDGRIISGAGLANYQKAVAPYHQEGIFLRDYNDPDWHRKTVFNALYRAKVWQPTEIYLYPHNIFLNFWIELGLAGMLLFIWIFIKYFYLGMKNLKLAAGNPGQSRNKYLTIGLIGAMAVIIIHGLVDVPYFKNDLAVMFWVLVATMSMINYKLLIQKQHEKIL